MELTLERRQCYCCKIKTNTQKGRGFGIWFPPRSHIVFGDNMCLPLSPRSSFLTLALNGIFATCF